MLKNDKVKVRERDIERVRETQDKVIQGKRKKDIKNI